MPGRVLVVDDHVLNVKLLEARLQIAGYQVETAFNGAEALAKLGPFAPHLVLLDIMMPGMDGYEVCRRIRNDADTARLPVVMVTALDKPSDHDAGRAAGANEVLLKPIEDDLLLPTVRRFVDQVVGA